MFEMFKGLKKFKSLEKFRKFKSLGFKSLIVKLKNSEIIFELIFAIASPVR